METKILNYTNEYIAKLQSISSKYDNNFTIILPEDLYSQLEFEIIKLTHCMNGNSNLSNVNNITVKMTNGGNVEFKKI